SRPGVRDSQGNVGAPHGRREGGHPSQRGAPDARREGRAGAEDPRRRAAHLRAHADDAGPEPQAPLPGRLELPVRLQRARERAAHRDRGARACARLAAPRMAHAHALDLARPHLKRLKEALPALAVIGALIAAWWIVVVRTESAIFPTPWQVITGAGELVEDGTLWDHIGASLFRVGTGFVLAVAVAVPLGLWMGWVRGAYATLNPLFQMLRPISPIAWIPLAILWFGVGDLSPIFLIFLSSVFPMIVQTVSG